MNNFYFSARYLTISIEVMEKEKEIEREFMRKIIIKFQLLVIIGENNDLSGCSGFFPLSK